MSEVQAALNIEHPDQLPSDIIRLKSEANELIRELVLKDGRIDVLADFVLGYPPQPFHYDMMEWQTQHNEGLLLAWRGAAKSTYCNITRCIFEILHNPNIRILITADSIGQSKGFLTAIKSHFENNQKFREVFGDWIMDAKVWAEDRITVNRRTAHHGEPTIMCAGVGTRLPSKHFEIIICDDLVTADNATTEGQRQKILDYFYQTLFPTLEQPNGKLWVLGTRWHEDDLYSWLQKEDYKDASYIMGVLDENDESRWDVKFPTETMHRIRKANLNAFELQWMCRSGVGIGGIFTPDHFLYYDGDPPANSFTWQGVDLAIGLKAHNDFFAHSTIAMEKNTRAPYLLEYRKVKISFPRQVTFLAEQFKAFPETVRVVVEANAFQLALLQQMRDTHPDVPVIGRYTVKDKIARAQQLAIYFTNCPMRVRRGHHEFVRLMCGFPNLKGSKDVFDSIEIAIGQALRGAKKRHREEPSLI